VGLLAGASITLSACSSSAQDGQSLAQQACVHVNRSVSDYLLAARSGTPAATAARLQDQADQQLRAALPLAAAANSDDGSWNSLMTTISESATIDEAHLIPSLRAQCVVADSNPNVNPQSPGNSSNVGNSGTTATTGKPRGTATTVPQNVNPEPASPAG
jgi:hypothetical protein